MVWGVLIYTVRSSFYRFSSCHGDVCSIFNIFIANTDAYWFNTDACSKLNCYIVLNLRFPKLFSLLPTLRIFFYFTYWKTNEITNTAGHYTTANFLSGSLTALLGLQHHKGHCRSLWKRLIKTIFFLICFTFYWTFQLLNGNPDHGQRKWYFSFLYYVLATIFFVNIYF